MVYIVTCYPVCTPCNLLKLHLCRHLVYILVCVCVCLCVRCCVCMYMHMYVMSTYHACYMLQLHIYREENWSFMLKLHLEWRVDFLKESFNPLAGDQEYK